MLEILSPNNYFKLALGTGELAVRGAQGTANMVAKTVSEVITRATGEKVPIIKDSSYGHITGDDLESVVLTPQPSPDK